MGTVKYTGPVASFHCPTNAEIRSLKVHFSPKQEGTGDPSPENVRPIVGWDGVEVHESRKNMGHIVGYSATTLASPLNKRNITNTYGTTLNTIDPESSLIISQAVWPETTNIGHYKNGYIAIELDNLVFDQYYDVSFKVTNITNNPLNATFQNLGLGVPVGTRRGPTEIRDNVLIYKNILFTQRDTHPNETDFDLRICGMSFTLSEFMVTPSDTNDGIYEPYTDKRIVTWNQWLQPLTSDNWQAYNTSKISTTFENGIATSTWLTNDGGYSTSVKNKVGTLQKNKEVWYISYMLKSSMSGGTWGAEYNGGLQNSIISNLDADTWCQCSEANLYWKGNRNYVYFSYYRGGISDHIGMVAQIKSPLFINLTQMFGLGNEPTKEEFEAQCALNGIDLTSALPYNEGTIMEWKTNGEEIKNTIIFPILGKNKFNINSSFSEPNNTTSSNSTNRIFQPYTYCLGLASGNSYLPSKITNVSITNGTLSFTSDNTSYGVAFAMPLPYGTYRLSYTGENISIGLVRYDKNGQIIYSGSSMNSQGIFTVGKNIDITCIIFKPTTANSLATVTNIQLEEGTTTTSYEAFDPNHTVYGGWVDLISGEVCEEYILLDKPWLEWGNKTVFEDGTELRYINFGTPVKGNGISNFKTSLCNVAKYSYGNENGKIHYYIVGNSYNCRVYLPIGTDENTQIQVLGELVTPINYYLAPTALQTFLGYNNVWSNADYVEVEYDLHETQDLLQRKAFIMANQPHVVKPAAASLQNFKTDVIAPLKECKVHFEPVQDLHGYDSPCPAGGGKNLFNNLYPNIDETVRYISVYVGTSTVTVSTNCPWGLNGQSACLFALAGNVQTGASSASNGLSPTLSRTIEPIDGYITIGYRIIEDIDPRNYNTQIELGSTATSYAPYENVCPIEGQNSFTIYQSSINIWDEQWEVGGLSNTTGENTIATQQIRSKNYIAVHPGQQLRIVYINTANGGSSNFKIVWYNQSKQFIDYSWKYAGAAWTVPANTYYIRFNMASAYGTTYQNDISINYPDTSRDYHSYNGSTIPIIFPWLGKNYYNATSITKTQADVTWTANNDYSITVSGTPTGYSMIITGTCEIPNSGKICISANFNELTNVAWDNYIIYNSNMELLESTGGGGTGYKVIDLDTYTDPKYIKLSFKRNNNNIETTGTIKPMIEIGTEPTSYEPYNIIYGGYVDLVNGEVIQEYELVADTWGNIKYSSVNSTTGYQYGRLFFKNPVVKAGMSNVNKVSYCNVGKYAWNLTDNATPHFYIDTISNTETYTAYVTLSSTTDDNLLITCAGKLINPIVYPLNSQILKTLRGTNNIWSNANGNIELAYWSH